MHPCIVVRARAIQIGSGDGVEFGVGGGRADTGMSHEKLGAGQSSPLLPKFDDEGQKQTNKTKEFFNILFWDRADSR